MSRPWFRFWWLWTLGSGLGLVALDRGQSVYTWQGVAVIVFCVLAWLRVREGERDG